MTQTAEIATTRPESPLPRKASREHRREQLIEATIRTLAELGYARTTMTAVAKAAGLSHGLVNFHFETKERLLTETLMFLADEYRENWQAALSEAGGSAAMQLDALLRADFNKKICEPNRLNAWCSFWGEAQSRPIYMEKCGSNDRLYAATLKGICERLIDEGGYRFEVDLVTRIIRVVSEGVWLDLTTMSNPYSRDEALRTVFTCAKAFFPKHFDENGLLNRPI